MSNYYIDVSDKKWINLAISIIIAPFVFIIWLLKIILKTLKKILVDVFNGVYKKMIAILVFLTVILVLSLFAGLIHQPMINSLALIK